MGQKVNPVSLRLQKTNRFYESSWYSDRAYNALLSQDITIRSYLNAVYKQIRYPQARYFFKYMSQKVSIYSFFHTPHESRKERANLLGSQRGLKTRPLSGMRSTGFSKRKILKGKFCSRSGQGGSRLVPTGKNTFDSKKSLQNLNKQQVHSLFYLLNGTKKGLVPGKVCKANFTADVRTSSNTSRFSFRLEKQFYIRYILALFLSISSIRNGLSRASCALPVEDMLCPVLPVKQEYKPVLSMSYVGGADPREKLLEEKTHWKKTLLNRLFLFRVLEKEYGLVLSRKYSEKPLFSALKESNSELYGATKIRYAQRNRAFTRFFNQAPISSSTPQILLPSRLHLQANATNHGGVKLITPCGVISGKALALQPQGFKVENSVRLVSQQGKAQVNTALTLDFLRKSGCTTQNKKVSIKANESPKIFLENSTLKGPLWANPQSGSNPLGLGALSASGLVPKHEVPGETKGKTFIVRNTPYRNHLESIILKGVVRSDLGVLQSRALLPLRGGKAKALQPQGLPVCSQMLTEVDKSKLSEIYPVSTSYGERPLTVELNPFKAKSDSQTALFLAEAIIYYLEKRVPFRRIKNRIFSDIAKKNFIKGVRISCSGRLGGRSKKAQRSKTECVKLGQTSLHVFSTKMDFAQKNALTPFGLVGVKVWISYK